MFKANNDYEHLLMLALEADQNLDQGLLSEDEINEIYFKLSNTLKKIDFEKSNCYFEEKLKELLKK